MADPYDCAIEDGLLRTLTGMRQAAGLSQQALAEKMNVSEVTIWKWENGMSFPRSLARLRKIATVLDGSFEIKLTTKDGIEFTF